MSSDPDASWRQSPRPAQPQRAVALGTAPLPTLPAGETIFGPPMTEPTGGEPPAPIEQPPEQPT